MDAWSEPPRWRISTSQPWPLDDQVRDRTPLATPFPHNERVGAAVLLEFDQRPWVPKGNIRDGASQLLGRIRADGHEYAVVPLRLAYPASFVAAGSRAIS